MHRRRERFHDFNVTLESYTDKLGVIRWGKVFDLIRRVYTTERSMNPRKLSPPAVKAHLIINVHNLKHCARGVLGGTAVANVVFLQQVSPHLFEYKQTSLSYSKGIQFSKLRVLTYNE